MRCLGGGVWYLVLALLLHDEPATSRVCHVFFFFFEFVPLFFFIDLDTILGRPCSLEFTYLSRGYESGPLMMTRGPCEDRVCLCVCVCGWVGVCVCVCVSVCVCGGVCECI